MQIAKRISRVFRIRVTALVCALVLTLPSIAAAVEYKISGLWQFRPFSWAQRNLEKGHQDDRLRAAIRFRTQIDIIASENLKGVVYFQIGHQNWGKYREGASLGTDGNTLGVRHSYVDWTVPQLDTRVRMGLQNFELPHFTTIGSPIVYADAAGVSLTHKFNDTVTGTLFWARLENDNVVLDTVSGGGSRDEHSYNMHDAMDFLGIALPVKTDGVKATPWGMYGFVGHDSFKNAGAGGVVMQGGMLPLGATAALAGTTDTPQGYAWYAGIAAQWNPTDAMNLALDAAYGIVDVGTTKLDNRNFAIKRAGWYAALLAEYKFDFGTPGFIFWYSSGDDANAYNGSERLPSIFPDMAISSYGSDNTYYGGAAVTLGYGLSGTWAAMFRINEMSFYDKLSHTLRVIYYQGTNNREMVRQGFIRNPQQTVTTFTYMTTSDRAVEVNVDSHYQMYKNFYMSVELGYIRMQQDTALWKSVGYEANKNNFKASLSFNYLF